MSIPYIQSTMADVRAVDGTYISHPFIEEGDTETKVYNMVCTQLATDYEASQVDLDTPMASANAAGVIELPFTPDVEAYYVGDTNHAPLDGGMLSFTRTFSNIPKPTIEDSGSSFVTFPGFQESSYSGNETITITGLSMTLGDRGIIVQTQSTHGYAVGGRIYIRASYTVDTDPFIHSLGSYFQILETPSTTTFRVDIGAYWDDQVDLFLIDGSVTDSNRGRVQASINTAIQTRYNYILPGVTPGITIPTDIEVPPAFQPVQQNSGETVKELVWSYAPAGVYFQTIPTMEEYETMIANKHHIVVESSLTTWAGNILVLQTKTCKAR